MIIIGQIESIESLREIVKRDTVNTQGKVSEI